MIPKEVLTEDLLQQAATKLAMALNDSLPPPNECQHKFSDVLKKKCSCSSRGSVPHATQYQFRILRFTNKLNGGLDLIQIADLLFQHLQMLVEKASI